MKPRRLPPHITSARRGGKVRKTNLTVFFGAPASFVCPAAAVGAGAAPAPSAGEATPGASTAGPPASAETRAMASAAVPCAGLGLERALAHQSPPTNST